MPVAKSKLFTTSPMTLQLTECLCSGIMGRMCRGHTGKKACTIKEEVSGKDKVTDAVITRVYPAGVSWSTHEQTPRSRGFNPEISTKRMSKQPRDKYIFDDFPTKGLQLKPRPKDILDSY